MKPLHILLLSLLLTLLCLPALSSQPSSPQQQQQQMQEQMQRYKFLLQLIEQFDNSGKGSVAKEDYAEFLAKVFIEGNKQEGYEIPDVGYLKRATLAFAESKEGEEIGVQDFYEDLLSKFYLFLSEKEEYQGLIGILFEGAEQGRVSEEIKNNNEGGKEGIEVVEL